MNGNEKSLIKRSEQIGHNKKRIEYLDIARGIAIILMIIGHVIGKGWKMNLIFSFHMPLFIIVSGYFFKEKKIKDFLINIFKKLILPYVLSVFIVDILKYAIIGKNNFIDVLTNYLKQILFSYSYIKSDIKIESLGILWFMPFLAIIRIIFYVAKKIAKENNILLGIICLFLSYVGYIAGTKGYWMPFSVDAALACMLFYYFGYLAMKKDIVNLIMNNKAILTVLLIIWVLTIMFGSIEIAVRKYPNGLFTYIGAICGSIIIMKISMFINSKLKYTSKILSWFGRNSMYILVGHYAETYLIKYNVIFRMLHSNTIKKVVYSITKIIITSIGTYIFLIIKKTLTKFKKQNV